VDPTGEWSLSKWWDKHWKEVAIVALSVAVVLTAGLVAPMAIGVVAGAFGVSIAPISASVTVASAFVCAGASAAAEYGLSGGKASFSQIMGAFVSGGVAGAFFPGIGSIAAKIGAIGVRAVVGSMALGATASFMGGVYGKVTQNIAGLGTEGDFKPSFDPRELLLETIIGGVTGPMPIGEKAATEISGIGPAKNFMSMWFRKPGPALFNPLRDSGQYFYASNVIDTTAGAILTWLGSLAAFGL